MEDISHYFGPAFIGILLSIAIFPLVVPQIWHHHYGKISFFWGLLFIVLLTINYGFNISAYYILEVYLWNFCRSLLSCWLYLPFQGAYI